MYDLVIKNTMIYDGMGAEPFVSDIAIKDGKIAAIGKALSGAVQTIEGAGLAVSPGWIDSHSHSDGAILTYPDQQEKVEQGITFSITGQCGGSAAPTKNTSVTEFFEKVPPQGSGSALLIGHNTLRKIVMGSENRDPTAGDLEQMKQLLAEGLDAGAIGMSLGLFYVPGCYAKTEEVVALAKVVAQKKGILAAHIRAESDTMLEALEEYLTIVKASGCRAVVSHHKVCEKHNWGKVKTSLAMIDAANAAGADVYMDVYPYTASGTTMLARFAPVQFHPPGTTSALALLYDPATCEAIKAWGQNRWGNDLSWVLLRQCPGYPQWEGKTVSEIAKELNMDDEYEVAFHITRQTEGKASACFFTICEEDMKRVVAHPRSMIGTDSSVAAALNRFHPRLRASFPRALGIYAREQQVVSIPEMIRKMTSLPAHVYGLKGKGRIAVGKDADLCVFDPETIRDRADYIHCKLPNVGLSYVIIDGKVVLEDGAYNGTRAAKVYRRKCNA